MINKTCIQNILSVLGKKKRFTPGGIIETAVSNVSTFKPSSVGRTLRDWSEDSEAMDSLLEKHYFTNPTGGRDCVEYRLRKTL